MGSFISWWLRDRESGRIVVIQVPNTPIWVYLVATGVRLSPYDRADTELGWVGTGALVVWGLDELARGVNPFRRLLGAAALVWQLTRIATR